MKKELPLKLHLEEFASVLFSTFPDLVETGGEISNKIDKELTEANVPVFAAAMALAFLLRKAIAEIEADGWRITQHDPVESNRRLPRHSARRQQ